MLILKKAAIALGSNLGDRLSFLQTAAKRIAEDVLEGMESSAVYETEPWGIKEQGKFLNAVVVGQTEWKAPAIIDYLKQLEKELGRIASTKNGPREIDLDLLCVESEIVEAPGVSVPHPRIQEREFVLRPLCDVWGNWKHPQLKKTAEELLEIQTTNSTVFLQRLL